MRSDPRSVVAGGRGRSYRVYRPAGLPVGLPAPLVVVLHGGFGSGAQAEGAYGWDEEADRHGFLVAYPDGIGRSWNAGGCCGPARRAGVDDVGFLSRMIDEVEAAEGVDPGRIYAAGISNGAMMAYRLACDLPGRLSAIGPVAGTMLCECPDPPPTSVLHIHGLDDARIPFEGGAGGRGDGQQPRPSVPSVIGLWRRAGGCGAPQVTDAPPVRAETARGAGGVEVALITVAGAGHQWPGSRPPPPSVATLLRLDQPSRALDATSVLWSFFAAHPPNRG